MVNLRTERGNIPKYVIIILLIMGAFGVMGGGLVAPGLTTIGTAFGAPRQQFGLILSVYTLSAAISLPIIGYFIDTAGRRKVGLICLAIDGVCGLAIILAPSFGVMLLLRFIQGIGIAGLIPVAMTIIGDLFKGEERLKFMGYLSGTISVGAVVIPTVGGALATVDWRLVFAVYGFSLILAVFFFYNLPETSSNDRSKEIQQNSLINYLSSLFSTLKIREIRNVMIHSLIVFFLLYTLVTFLPIYLVIGHGFSELFTGLALSLQGAFAAILASRATYIREYFDWRKRAALGFFLIALCFFLLPMWSKGSYLVSLSFVIYGTGMGIVTPTIYNRATHLPPPELTGSVVAVFNTMKYVGMTLSPFIIGFSLLFILLDTVFIAVGLMAVVWGSITLKSVR